jgi:IMP dehydrogenase/GMP reductase
MRLTDWTVTGHKAAKAVTLLGGIGGGVIVYFLCASLLRCEEVRDAKELFQRKVMKR